MIRYGLKLWSNNADWFREARSRYARGEFDFIELYHNSIVALDWATLEQLRSVPVLGVHIGHLEKENFHEFFLNPAQQPAWAGTKALADFFQAHYIVVHPGRLHTVETLLENLALMNDRRVVLENMAGLDTMGRRMECGVTLTDLRALRSHYEILFDLEKAFKAAGRDRQPYRELVAEALTTLAPRYFHISGGVKTTAQDEHLDLWVGDIDVAWLASTLTAYAKDKEVFLAFETPKVGNGLANDVRNIEFFKAQVN